MLHNSNSENMGAGQFSGKIRREVQKLETSGYFSAAGSINFTCFNVVGYTVLRDRKMMAIMRFKVI